MIHDLWILDRRENFCQGVFGVLHHFVGRLFDCALLQPNQSEYKLQREPQLRTNQKLGSRICGGPGCSNCCMIGYHF